MDERKAALIDALARKAAALLDAEEAAAKAKAAADEAAAKAAVSEAASAAAVGEGEGEGKGEGAAGVLPANGAAMAADDDIAATLSELRKWVDTAGDKEHALLHARAEARAGR